MHADLESIVCKFGGDPEFRTFVCEKKRFAQKFAEGQTDIRTDDGRRAITLAHSWNKLKTCNKSVYLVGELCCCERADAVAQIYKDQ